MPKPYISNYDKYPLVRVSDSQDGCETGWDAIGRRLKASVRPGRFVICVECYPGCFEKDIVETTNERIEASDRVARRRILPARSCYPGAVCTGSW